jgi:hypothetical protein
LRREARSEVDLRYGHGQVGVLKALIDFSKILKCIEQHFGREVDLSEYLAQKWTC